MKRFWLGLSLMVLLLSLGITATVRVQQACRPISRCLGAAIHTRPWEQATELTAEAQRQWQRLRHGGASITDHEPMEQIDALFGSLAVYARHRDRVHFDECCAQLVALTEALAEAQAVNWWNIL